MHIIRNSINFRSYFASDEMRGWIGTVVNWKEIDNQVPVRRLLEGILK
jgi:hypothetical protein